jgi:hypothetical protein
MEVVLPRDEEEVLNRMNRGVSVGIRESIERLKSVCWVVCEAIVCVKETLEETSGM